MEIYKKIDQVTNMFEGAHDVPLIMGKSFKFQNDPISSIETRQGTLCLIMEQ